MFSVLVPVSSGKLIDPATPHSSRRRSQAARPSLGEAPEPGQDHLKRLADTPRRGSVQANAKPPTIITHPERTSFTARKKEPADKKREKNPKGASASSVKKGRRATQPGDKLKGLQVRTRGSPFHPGNATLCIC